MDISEILSSLSEDDIKQLQETASAIFGNNQKTENTELNKPSGTTMFSDISKLGSVLSQSDERTAFVEAMKPLLSEDKQQRADEVIKILRLISLIPVLRESGILSGLL